MRKLLTASVAFVFLIQSVGLADSPQVALRVLSSKAPLARADWRMVVAMSLFSLLGFQGSMEDPNLGINRAAHRKHLRLKPAVISYLKSISEDENSQLYKLARQLVENWVARCQRPFGAFLSQADCYELDRGEYSLSEKFDWVVQEMESSRADPYLTFGKGREEYDALALELQKGFAGDYRELLERQRKLYNLQFAEQYLQGSQREIQSQSIRDQADQSSSTHDDNQLASKLGRQGWELSDALTTCMANMAVSFLSERGFVDAIKDATETLAAMAAVSDLMHAAVLRREFQLFRELMANYLTLSETLESIVPTVREWRSWSLNDEQKAALAHFWRIQARYFSQDWRRERLNFIQRILFPAG